MELTEETAINTISSRKDAARESAGSAYICTGKFVHVHL